MIIIIIIIIIIIPRLRVGYELAIIISYPTCKRKWNNCFIKNAHKISTIRFFPTLFVKTTD